MSKIFDTGGVIFACVVNECLILPLHTSPPCAYGVR